MNFLFHTYRGIQLLNVLSIILNAAFVVLQFVTRGTSWWTVFATLNAVCVLLGFQGLYRMYKLKRDGLI
jgi:hypothetical protein